jgi:hypothetical protein
MKRDRVLCVVFGRFSKCLFMLESDIPAWLQTIPKSERNCVTRIETDLDPADLDFINRTQTIIDRAELEADEATLRLDHYLKSRKGA